MNSRERVQLALEHKEPGRLKRTFGDKLVFWGGAVDTQRTLPFGTPDQVRAEVRARIADFAPGGGWVFNTVHNVQPLVPIENLLAMYETYRQYATYPISV